jgi:hypothetical protein
MKKLVWLALTLLFLTGCNIGKDMTNNPTSKVEGYLDSYKKLDKKVLDDLDEVIDNNKYTLDQRTTYKELMKKHYQDLSYEIKNETINGDKANVEVAIEVRDYSKVLSAETNPDDFKDENGEYSDKLFYDYQLKQMGESKETVSYTIIFYLTRKDDRWEIDPLTEPTKEKIHGIYQY